MNYMTKLRSNSELELGINVDELDPSKVVPPPFQLLSSDPATVFLTTK